MTELGSIFHVFDCRAQISGADRHERDVIAAVVGKFRDLSGSFRDGNVILDNGCRRRPIETNSPPRPQNMRPAQPQSL